MQGLLFKFSVGLVCGVLLLCGCATNPDGDGAAPKFSKLPDGCPPIIAPAKAEIASFAGDLFDPDVQFRADSSSTPLVLDVLRCGGGYAREVSSWDIADRTVSRTRHIYIAFTMSTADDLSGNADPVKSARHDFAENRPGDASTLFGIGQESYYKTETPSSDSVVSKVNFRIDNLEVLVRLSGTNYEEKSSLHLRSTVENDARSIAKVLSDNVDSIMPR